LVCSISTILGTNGLNSADVPLSSKQTNCCIHSPDQFLTPIVLRLFNTILSLSEPMRCLFLFLSLALLNHGALLTRNDTDDARWPHMSSISSKYCHFFVPRPLFLVPLLSNIKLYLIETFDSKYFYTFTLFITTHTMNVTYLLLLIFRWNFNYDCWNKIIKWCVRSRGGLKTHCITISSRY